MSMFEYRCVRTDGSVSEGTIDAGGRRDALLQLEGRGLKPIRLTETANGNTERTGGFGFAWGTAKVSFRALENFTRLLSSLLAAGIPLSRALRILCNEASTPAAKAKWEEIRNLVVDGTSLADAMAQSPETFPRVYAAMVQAGETGGFLDVVLGQIADFQTREKELRSKVFSAMIYPAILLVLALGVLVFLLVFFIPRFQKVFAGFGGTLPLLTRIIVEASEVVRTYGLWVGIGIGIAYISAQQWFRSDRGRRVWEGWVLRLPVVGVLIARFAMARFCRMLGTLIGAGVPLIHSLHVARQSIDNQILVDAVVAATDRVKKGDRLAASLAECGELFPRSVLEMIAVAEETGRLDKELVRLAATAEGDLDRNLKTAVALAEPLMLFLIAGFIGTIFVGMVIPIFTISDYIK